MKVLRVFGPDARDFLHRITAGTVKSLKSGEGAGGLLCNGQSRLIAQFDLLCRNDADFFLVSPVECFAALQAGLEKMQFAEQLEFSERGGARIVASGEKKRANVFGWTEENWPAAVPGYSCAFGEGPTPAEYEYDRIRHGVPSVKDWDGQTPALEAGMLPWIDRHKGCYPGQEVVELSLNVGNPARALVVWEKEGEIRPGKIALPDGGEALITSVANKGNHWVCLARVPWKKQEIPAAGFRKVMA